MLNEYFGIMVEAIFKYDGMIDKYMGDCVMAVWGAWREEEQDDALRAVLAAMEMQSQLRALNADREARGRPRIIAGAGINTGYVAAGSLGAATETVTQWEYAVIGDNVNLAQRIEAQTDGYQVIISEPTYEEVREHVTVRKLAPLRLKGRRDTVAVYLVTGLAGGPPMPEEPAPPRAFRLHADLPEEGDTP
jgi:adenylate cyclase